MPDNDWRPKLVGVDDPIADDHWEYVASRGKRRVSRLTVGRPVYYARERLWYCPVRIEGYTAGVDTVFGLGPVDALMNAMTLVKRFFDEKKNVVPGVKSKRSRQRRSRGRAPTRRKTKA
jgi:hypothetical protein